MNELVIDSFAGGGGASEGIRAAIGRDPDIAVNHDGMALAMHRMNHPDTHHIEEDVVTLDARAMCAGRPIGMLWMSPDCKHHSKAKGGKPRDKNIRGLAWTVLGWVKRLPPWQRPRVVFLENVEEFAHWGPLDESGRPCPAQRGAIFRQYVEAWQALGYQVEHRELRACDYGVPTIRKRLYWIARRDGKPIVWPSPTHGDPKSEAVHSGRLQPWVAAATIIDWYLPCPSIFDSSAEIKARYGIRAIRPLADATLARVAKGTMRYVVKAAKPFIVQVNHGGGSGGRAHAADEPAPTMTQGRGEALVTPFVTKFNTGSVGSGMDEPLHTITSHASDTHGGGAAPLGIVAPYLVRTAHGEQDRNGKRRGRGDLSTEDPMPTVLASNDSALVAPFLTPRYQEKLGQEPRVRSVQDPAATIIGGDNVPGHLAAVHLQKQYGKSVGHGADEPAHTLVGKGNAAVVAAFLAQHNTDMVGHDAGQPVSTIVGKGCTQGLVAAHMLNMRGSDRRGSAADEPAPTFSAQGTHAAVVAAFLAKYYGAGAPVQAADDPLHTLTAKPRHGLVTVTIAGEPFVIVDIGMRMLTPRERFNAQGFRGDYVIDRGRLEDGSTVPFTLEQQGRFCGNSVCPEMARMLVAANYAARTGAVSRRAGADAPLFSSMVAAE